MADDKNEMRHAWAITTGFFVGIGAYGVQAALKESLSPSIGQAAISAGAWVAGHLAAYRILSKPMDPDAEKEPVWPDQDAFEFFRNLRLKKTTDFSRFLSGFHPLSSDNYSRNISSYLDGMRHAAAFLTKNPLSIKKTYEFLHCAVQAGYHPETLEAIRYLQELMRDTYSKDSRAKMLRAGFYWLSLGLLERKNRLFRRERRGSLDQKIISYSVATIASCNNIYLNLYHVRGWTELIKKASGIQKLEAALVWAILNTPLENGVAEQAFKTALRIAGESNIGLEQIASSKNPVYIIKAPGRNSFVSSSVVLKKGTAESIARQRYMHKRYAKSLPKNAPRYSCQLYDDTLLMLWEFGTRIKGAEGKTVKQIVGGLLVPMHNLGPADRDNIYLLDYQGELGRRVVEFFAAASRDPGDTAASLESTLKPRGIILHGDFYLRNLLMARQPMTIDYEFAMRGGNGAVDLGSLCSELEGYRPDEILGLYNKKANAPLSYDELEAGVLLASMWQVAGYRERGQLGQEYYHYLSVAIEHAAKSNLKIVRKALAGL